ncbi:hypothetical protein Hanom_Chr10g00962121 [Helianthus anomalus]
MIGLNVLISFNSLLRMCVSSKRTSRKSQNCTLSSHYLVPTDKQYCFCNHKTSRFRKIKTKLFQPD